MSISAADVKKLRTMTGSGFMDCKKALTDAKGDYEKAVELLRKKGKKVADKRADRETKEGLVLIRISDDGCKAAAIEINCETDFVARNEEFHTQAGELLDVVFDNDLATVGALNKYGTDGSTVANRLEDMTSKTGEKIGISKVLLTSTKGRLISYIHPGNQLGVLVEFEGKLADSEVGRNVAMQVAAMKPLAVTREEVDPSIIQKELEIAKEQLINEGKGAEIAEKAAQGKLQRFYEERVLLDQKFVKDNTITIRKYLQQHNEPLVRTFYRIKLGEKT